MSFLAPYFLIGLIGLAIPVIIHLWSKNTRKSVLFGSVKFLQGTETKTMRSIAPSQWLLLLIRMIMLLLLVFILAELVLQKDRPTFSREYYLDIEYRGEKWLETFMDSVQNPVRWLARGFPLVDENIESDNMDHWLLLSSIQSNAEEVIVLSPRLSKNYSGKSLSISEKIKLVKMPTDPIDEEIASFSKGDKVVQLIGHFEDWKTTFQYDDAQFGDPISISYQIKGGDKKQRSIFESAMASLNELTYLTMEPTNDKPEWIINLRGDEVDVKAKVISIHPHQLEKWKVIGPNVVSISDDWDEQDAIRMNLPDRLLNLFARDLLDVSEFDQLSMDEAMFARHDHPNPQSIAQQGSINPLWVLFLFMLLAERWFSSKSDAK